MRKYLSTTKTRRPRRIKDARVLRSIHDARVLWPSEMHGWYSPRALFFVNFVVPSFFGSRLGERVRAHHERKPDSKLGQHRRAGRD